MNEPGAPPRSELEEERDFLLESIRDLDAEREAGDLDEADYRSLRDQYTSRAAAVLRALEGDAEPVAASEPDSSSAAGASRAGDYRTPRRGRLIAGVLVVLLLAGLAGAAISSSAGERLPGEQLSGSITEGTNSKIARAQQLVSEGEVLEAIRLYDEVLADDPEHPVALAQRGWLLSRAGLTDEGLAYVDRAIASEPAYAEARFFRAMILREKGDRDAAAEELRALLALDPPPQLAELAESLLAELDTEPAP